MEEFDEPRSAPRPKPSNIPSWTMLGFLLGALCMWALPSPKPPRVSAPPPILVNPAPPPRLTDLEAAFEKWGPEYAVWVNDITYVCLWDAVETRSFRDCFQVVRQGRELYFRSIPRPRNLRARDDVPRECPLEFLNPIPEERGLFGAPLPKPDTPSSK